jgi:DNA-binding XRE family transcriptional regulator
MIAAMKMPDAETTVENLAALFREARKKKKLSHQAVADKAGVHRSTISLIESGKIMPTILVCIKIARALEIDLAKLLLKASAPTR